jgi:hypothetical protein
VSEVPPKILRKADGHLRPSGWLLLVAMLAAAAALYFFGFAEHGAG